MGVAEGDPHIMFLTFPLCYVLVTRIENLGKMVALSSILTHNKKPRQIGCTLSSFNPGLKTSANWLHPSTFNPGLKTSANRLHSLYFQPRSKKPRQIGCTLSSFNPCLKTSANWLRCTKSNFSSMILCSITCKSVR